MIRTRKRLTDVSMSWCIFVVGGGGEAKGDCEFVSGCNCVWSVSVRWSVCLRGKTNRWNWVDERNEADYQ